MPGMDGIELAKRAAELNAALKIMFITGFAAVALHPASERPQTGQGAVQALPPARDRGGSGADDGRRLKPAASVPAQTGHSRLALPEPAPAIQPASFRQGGRVAQRESTSLTWKGSQVRSLSRPPFLPVTRSFPSRGVPAVGIPWELTSASSNTRQSTRQAPEQLLLKIPAHIHRRLAWCGRRAAGARAGQEICSPVTRGSLEARSRSHSVAKAAGSRQTGGSLPVLHAASVTPCGSNPPKHSR